MKLIHYLFFILIGVIIYKYIQNIEGLTCFTPFHDVLGDDTTQYRQVNKGSYPVLLKDNLVLQAPATAAPAAALDFPAQGSQESRVQTFNDTNTLNVVCDPGDATFPPWQLSGGADKVLTCKNPTAKVIIGSHGRFTTQGVINSMIGSRGQPSTMLFGSGSVVPDVEISTKIFKRMQVFTYLNEGDCFTFYRTGDKGQLYNNIFNGRSRSEYFSLIQDCRFCFGMPENMNHFNTVFSEMAELDKLLLLSDDTTTSLIQFTHFQQIVNLNGGIPQYYDTGDYFIAKLSFRDSDWAKFYRTGERDKEAMDLRLVQQLQASNINIDFINIYWIVSIFNNLHSGDWNTPGDSIGGAHNYLGPFMSMYCGITFADNSEFYLDPYFTNSIRQYSTLEYERDTTTTLGHDVHTATFTISKIHINGYRLLIKKSLLASCVTIERDKLSPMFRHMNIPVLNRLFPNQETSVELPLFSLNILTTPMFVNPRSDDPYSLPGGQYTSEDIILVILDIIDQIKSHSGGYYQIFINILKKMGMSDSEINNPNGYISSLQLFIIKSGIIESGIEDIDTDVLSLHPRGFIFNILRDLWLPWGYNIMNIGNMKSYNISAPVIFMLLQLFKQNGQNDYNKLDVHMLTCFSGGSDRDLNRRDSTMNYSWEYTWDDAEIATNGNPLARKIGPTCDKKSCEETKDQINAKLVAQGKGDFEVDDASYREKTASGIHPTYETKTYSRDAQNNIIINENVDQSTKIKVNCKNDTNRNTVIECKYNQGPPATFNYDESIINEVDPRICHDSEALDLSVEVAEVDVVEAVCSVKQAQCVPQRSAGGLRFAFKC